MESPAAGQRRRTVFDPARVAFRASSSPSLPGRGRETEAQAECDALRAENAILEQRMAAMLSVCSAADDTLSANTLQLREAETERRELESALTDRAARIAALEARARSSASVVVQLREEKRLAEARCAEVQTECAGLRDALAAERDSSERRREEAALASKAWAEAQAQVLALRVQLQEAAAPPPLPPRGDLARLLTAACLPPFLLALLLHTNHRPSQLAAALLCSMVLVSLLPSRALRSEASKSQAEAHAAELTALLAASERAAQAQRAASALASREAEAELRALHAAAREALEEAEARVAAAQRNATPEAKVAAVARLAAAIVPRDAAPSPPPLSPPIRAEQNLRRVRSPARLTREEAAMLASLLEARSPTRDAGAAQKRIAAVLAGLQPGGALAD